LHRRMNATAIYAIRRAVHFALVCTS